MSVTALTKKVKASNTLVLGKHVKAIQRLISFACEEQIRIGPQQHISTLNLAAYTKFHGEDGNSDDIGLAGAFFAYWGRFANLKIIDEQSRVESFHSIFRGLGEI